jgi:hypothetical protein
MAIAAQFCVVCPSCARHNRVTLAEILNELPCESCDRPLFKHAIVAIDNGVQAYRARTNKL